MRWKRTVIIATCIMLTMIAIASAATAATISGDSWTSVPSSGKSGAYTVSGTGFLTNAQVWVRSPTGVNYAVTETGWSSTSISGTLTVPSGAAPGYYGVYVQNPGQTAIYRSNVFYKVPSISGDNLAGIPRTGWTGTYTVNGNGFLTNAQVWVRSPAGVNYQVTERSWSATAISGSLTIPSTAVDGNYAVYVQNPGQTATYRSNVFWKGGAVITTDNLASVPKTGWTGTYTVTGSGFLTNAQVWVRSPAGVNYQVAETSWTSTAISGTLTIPSTAAAGNYAVYVQNPYQTAVSKSSVFYKVSSAAITGDNLVSVPSAGWSGTYTVTGSGFKTNAQVWVRSSAGVNYYVTETGWTSTSVTGSLTIPSTAAAGNYAVYVQNPGETQVTLANVFSKLAPTTGYPRNVELEVIRLVNLERTSRGVAALQWNEALALCARSHSDDMALHNIFQHSSYNGQTWNQRLNSAGFVNLYMSENIAYRSGSMSDNPTTVAQGFVSQWMASTAGHRENILNGVYKRTGVGIAYDSDRGIWLATQDFVS